MLRNGYVPKSSKVSVSSGSMEVSPNSVLPHRNVERFVNKGSEFTSLKYSDSLRGFFEVPVSKEREPSDRDGTEKRKKISMSHSNDSSFFLTAVDFLYRFEEEKNQNPPEPSISYDFIEFHPTFSNEGKYSLGKCRVSSASHLTNSSYSSSTLSSPISTSNSPRKLSSPAHLIASIKLDEHRGLPHFEFSMNTPEKSYVAMTWRSENAFNWVYTFHSIKRRNTNRGKSSVTKDSSMVGQMHVSCSASSSSLITEFVVYDISHATSASVDEPKGLHFLRPGFEIAAIVVELPFVKKEERTVHVVVPRGRHSMGQKGSEGPSPLLERWRCGGACDCGGWDMACSLTVLSDFGHMMDLYVLGRKENIPAVAVDAVRKGEYSVVFHGELSALQAFAICAALLHARDSENAMDKFRR